MGTTFLITFDNDILVIYVDKTKTYNDAKINPNAFVFAIYYQFKV